MRNEFEIISEMDAVKASRHEKGDNITLAELSRVNDKMSALRAELQALWIEGAKPCLLCKAAPHMVKKARGYRAFCINDECKNDLRFDGGTPQEAVANWNKQAAS